MQKYERRLIFENVSKHDTLDDARALIRATEEYAATRERVYLYPAKVGKSKPYRLRLRWCYGWVKGGFPSDGRRFMWQAINRAGLTADVNVRVVREDKCERAAA